MRSLKKSGFIAALVAVAAMFLVYVPSQAAYPPRGDDGPPLATLGQFKMFVMPQYHAMVFGCPGFNPVDGKWDGPLMRDSNTIIGRSDPHADAAAPDNPPGTPVGTVGTMISDADFTIRALQCGGDGPPGQQEIHTEVRRLNMTGLLGSAIRAGDLIPGYPALKGDGTPTVSPGEVEDQPGPGPDFPAESFFDIYVEVDLPNCGNIPGNPVIYNRIPMVVYNCALMSLPPTVVYRHDNTSAVPVYFRDNNPPLWNAGDLFGLMLIAGHGVEVSETEFLLEYETFPEMPCPTCDLFLAVELTSFTAVAHDGYVSIDWTTETEIGNAGFNLYRSASEIGEKSKLNDGLIPSKGNDLEGATYSFKDTDVASGVTYYYWFEDVGVNGKTKMRGPVLAERKSKEIPTASRLAQNIPNPFNPITEIRYDLAEDCHVKLEVYNIFGQRVATLVDEYQTAGSKVSRWDVKGTKFSSGIYFYRLQAGSFVETRKMVLLK